MISIIICSRIRDISSELRENIETTIGIEYELIVIDNSKNKYSIFSAYNEGVRLAKGDILCFMHEDVWYHTQHWGEKVINHLQNSEVGLLGTIGTHFLPKTPIGWYQSKVVSGGGLVGVSKNGKIELEHHLDSTYLKDDLSIEAVAVDGLWFCIPKTVFSFVSFDELTFNGFHCYDLDICLQVRKTGFQVRIIADILLEHLSNGIFTIEWVKSTHLFFEKWKNQLPQVAGVNLSPLEMKMREELADEIFLWMSANAQNRSELEQVRKSKAYQLGKFIIKPFSSFRRVFKR